MADDNKEPQTVKGHFVNKKVVGKGLSLSSKIWEVEEQENTELKPKVPAQTPVPAVSASKSQPKRSGTKYFLYVAMGVGGIMGLMILGLLVMIWLRPVGQSTGNQSQSGMRDKILESEDKNKAFDLSTDSDQDAIPDEVERQLGYDPERNDCVREVGCGDYANVPRAKLRLNLVFVLDASGSMNSEVNGVNKWQSAVSALKSVLGKGFPGYTEVGLVVYGHKGNSSVEQRETSCNGVEVVSELSPIGNNTIRTKVDELTPSGWTPLAQGLSKAGEMLADRQGEGNFVVLLSDGLETCDGDPVKVAQTLKDGGIEVTTNVVGLAVNDDEKQQLMAIASAGGGNFYPADNPQDLEKALVLSSEVIRSWEQINKCIVDNVVKYSSCVGTQYLKSINFVKDRRVKLQSEVAPNAGGVGVVNVDTYLESEKKMWSTYGKLKNENWTQYQSDLDSLVVGN